MTNNKKTTSQQTQKLLTHLGVFLFQLSKQTCNKNFKKIKMLQKVQQKKYFKKNVAKVATKKIKSKKCCKKNFATNSRIKISHTKFKKNSCIRG